MPNTEVKLINAESTWPEAAREDRKLLIKETPTQIGVGVFCCVFGSPAPGSKLPAILRLPQK